MKTKKKMTIGLDDYIKVNKKLAREEELARNGGRWVAKDRPHKNLKKYDRKRDKKNIDSYLSPFFSPHERGRMKQHNPPWESPCKPSAGKFAWLCRGAAGLQANKVGLVGAGGCNIRMVHSNELPLSLLLRNFHNNHLFHSIMHKRYAIESMPSSGSIGVFAILL